MKMDEFLSNAGLEKYIDIFKSQEVGIEQVPHLSPFMIDKLIGVVGDQIKFNVAVESLNHRKSSNNHSSIPASSPTDQTESSNSGILNTAITTPIQVRSTSPGQQTNKQSHELRIESSYSISDTLNNTKDIQEPPAKRFKPYDSTDCQNIFSNVEEFRKFLEIAAKVVIDFFEGNGYLNTPTQTLLNDTLALKIIATYGRSTPPKVYQNCQNFIKEIFPSDKGGWYIPPYTENKAQKIAKGKLVYRVRNRLSKLKTDGITIDGRDQAVREKTPAIYDLIPDETYAELKLYLSHYYKPWSKTEELWSKSAPNRLSEISDDNLGLSAILKSWPLYKHPMGHRLIKLDFDVKYPNKGNLFLNKWIHHADKLSRVLTNSLSKETYSLVEILEEPVENDDNVTRDAISLYLLPARLPPSIIHESQVDTEVLSAKGKGKGKGTGKGKGRNNCSTTIRKPSIVESQISFINICTNSGEMKQEISRIEKDYSEAKRCLQPFMIFVGEDPRELRHFYLYFSGITYEFETPLAAVESCFKVFQVLSLNYPPESANVWMFIQKQFFNLDTEGDVVPAAVTGLMGQL